jgi:quercetin dioxygenase-like cupin family protein
MQTVKIVKIEDIKEFEIPKYVKAVKTQDLIGPKATGSTNLQVFYSKFEPGGESYPHSHDVESGHIILRGKILLTTDEGSKEIGPNTVIFIPPKVRHGLKTIGHETAHMIVIFSPPEESYERR